MMHLRNLEFEEPQINDLIVVFDSDTLSVGKYRGDGLLAIGICYNNEIIEEIEPQERWVYLSEALIVLNNINNID